MKKKKELKILKVQEDIFRKNLEEISNQNAKILSEEAISNLISSNMKSFYDDVEDYTKKLSHYKELRREKRFCIFFTLLPIILGGTIALSTMGGYALWHNPDDKCYDNYSQVYYTEKVDAIDTIDFDLKSYSFDLEDTNSSMESYAVAKVYTPSKDKEGFLEVRNVSLTEEEGKQYIEQLQQKKVPDIPKEFIDLSETILDPIKREEESYSIELHTLEEKMHYSKTEKDGYEIPKKIKVLEIALAFPITGLILSPIVYAFGYAVNYDMGGFRKDFRGAKEEYIFSKRKIKQWRKK